MARRAQNLIIIYLASDGALKSSVHGEDETGARRELAVIIKNGVKAKLIDGTELAFGQEVVIGVSAAPARKKPAAKRGKRDDKPENGTPAPATESIATNPLDAE